MGAHYEPPIRFCPVCGGPLEKRRVRSREPERSVCGECGFIFYLDPKVAACSVVEMEGRIILLRRAMQPEKGKWVMPGGYVDRGEAVPAAALRETREECGIETRIKDLLGVYSYPGRIAVVVVYTAEYVSGAIEVNEEHLEAKLFPQDEIPWEELAFPSTSDALKDHLKNKETIPCC